MRQLTISLKQIAYLANECSKIRKELIAAGQPWIRESITLSRLSPTEFERAQGRLIAACDVAHRQLARVRRTSSSSVAIKADTTIGKIRTCCRQCRTVNLHNQARKRPFVCLVEQNLNQIGPSGFRLRLARIFHKPGESARRKGL